MKATYRSGDQRQRLSLLAQFAAAAAIGAGTYVFVVAVFSLGAT